MSRSRRSSMRIGCPGCGDTVDATVPPGPGIVDPDDGGPNRLRGKETCCTSCGHELELYYY